MSLYVYPDGHYALRLGASHHMVRRYHEGARTLVHVPALWPVLRVPPKPQSEPMATPMITTVVVFELRSLRVGDEVGLYMPPRIQMTTITSIETMPLHSMVPGDLVALGRTEQDMDAYRASWDKCWAEDGWPWSSNPEVLAIRWEALHGLSKPEKATTP
jgi:hypothetical protein